MISNKNYNKLIKKILEDDALKKLIDSILEETDDLYLVGGAIRDSFIGKKVKDLDFATPIFAEDLAKKLREKNFKVIETGINHGTLTVVVNNSNIEITTFREGSSRDNNKYSDNILSDLEGRDFTINAIAWNVKKEELLDPFLGEKDLEDKILKSPKNAELRIIEDPLRIFRMLRFGPANNFTVDTKLLNACKKNANLVRNISPERIQTELNKILISKNPEKAFNIAKEINLFQFFLPEIIPSILCAQNDFHVEDVFEHTLTVISRTSSESLLLRLVALFHDLGKPKTLSVDEEGRRHFYKHELESRDIALKVLERLKYSKSLTKRVAKLVEYHMRPLDCGPAGVRRLIRDLDADFENWLSFKRADKPPIMPENEFNELYKSFIKKWKTELAKAKNKPFGKLAINGNDLIKIGFVKGAKIGITIKKLEEMVIDNPSLNNYDELINLAKTYI